MNRNILPVVVIVMVGVATSSCSKPPPAEDELHKSDEMSSTTSENLPLVQIMQGLETDLAEVAHGIWTREPEAVRVAAIRIAEHPKVPPEQLSVIKLELDDELGSFVQFDGIVHSAAVELAAAVDSSGNLADLFGIYHRIQQGCFSCHSAFQTRVSEALSRVEN